MDHLDTIHPNQCGIVCPICDKELPSKRRLKIHVVIHSDKKATCPVRIFQLCYVFFTTDKLRKKLCFVPINICFLIQLLKKRKICEKKNSENIRWIHEMF